MKNKLVDMHNMMFMELERLNDEDMTDEQFEKEMRRASAMAAIGSVVVKNASVMLSAQKNTYEYGETAGNFMLEDNSKQN